MWDIINKEDLLSVIYTLVTLQYRGLSIKETLRTSLIYYRKWYLMTGERKYLDLAVLHFCAGMELSLLEEKDLELYHSIFETAGISINKIIEKKLHISRRIKPSRNQVQALIKKWNPTKYNPMTSSQIVDDIIEKVKNKQIGEYYYCNKCMDNIFQNNLLLKDIYKLVVNDEESFFVDYKSFKFYIFERC